MNYKLGDIVYITSEYFWYDIDRLPHNVKKGEAFQFVESESEFYERVHNIKYKYTVLIHVDNIEEYFDIKYSRRMKLNKLFK